jgi:ribonuclease PH
MLRKGRGAFELRDCRFEIHANAYAEGSVLVKAGNTHVLCTASVESSVPAWLSGKGKGWISAQYAMLPRATQTRNAREREKISGRTQEIQRLIGRSLRAMVDLKLLGERSIIIDCDVLQADGGTRTWSVSGGCIALIIALRGLIQSEKIAPEAIKNMVAGVSVGVFDKSILVDLDYSEDVSCDVDANFVFTEDQKIIEIQGTAEKASFSSQQFHEMLERALESAEKIHQLQRKVLGFI